MNAELNSHLKEIALTRTPLVVDAWEYGRQLLGKGNQPPWDDVATIVSWHKRLQSLVNSDVLLIEVDSFYQSWLQRDPALLTEMGSKRRLGYALRTLLAFEEARTQLQEIVNAICSCYANIPVLLAVPSPKQWLARAHCSAQKIETVDVSWEDAESASMYMADFLRNFSNCEISGLLLRDDEEKGAACDNELMHYQPVINVAEHYRWQIMLDGCAGNYQPGADTGVTFSLGSDASELQGLKLSANGSDVADLPGFNGQGFWYVMIPEDGVPERVLEILEGMRKRKA